MAPSREPERVLKQGMHNEKGKGKKSPKEAKAADAPKARAPKYKRYGRIALGTVFACLACVYYLKPARQAGNVVGRTTCEVAKSLPENVLEASESKPELTEAKDLVDENDQSKEKLQETCGVDACCPSLAVSVHINRCLRLIRDLGSSAMETGLHIICSSRDGSVISSRHCYSKIT